MPPTHIKYVLSKYHKSIFASEIQSPITIIIKLIKIINGTSFMVCFGVVYLVFLTISELASSVGITNHSPYLHIITMFFNLQRFYLFFMTTSLAASYALSRIDFMACALVKSVALPLK